MPDHRAVVEPSSLPPPGHLRLIARQAGYWGTLYRRTWRGSAVSSFLTPVLYLLSMGVLLGRFVDASKPSLGPATSYLQFVGPGLLAAHVMQLAMDDVLWPVMGRLVWNKTYQAMIATPLGVIDIFAGNLLFVLWRVACASAVFLCVLVAAGVFRSAGGVVAVFGVQLLTGLAFAATFFSVGATARSGSAFSVVYRVVLMPLFLFSGAFFPITNLPWAVQVAARATPLWHSVELSRMCALDAVDWSRVPIHVGYLVGLSILGVLLGVRALRRRLTW